MELFTSLVIYARNHKDTVKRLIPRSILLLLKKKYITAEIQSIEKKRASFHKENYLKGVNLIGNICCETGLGQSCRLVARMLEIEKVPFTIKEWYLPDYQRNDDKTFMKYVDSKIKYGINIIHINPFELKMALPDIKNVFTNRYNIAFWLWELEKFPNDWIEIFSILDEVWVPSEYTAKSIKKKTDIPVHVFPYYLETKYDSTYSKSFFGMKEKVFYFLVMFDSVSTMARKNPLATIRAFKEAFTKEQSQVGIVIKINNAVPEDVEILKEELHGYQNVIMLDKVLDKLQVNSLIKASDVLVSLHRAEGYGLTIAEAMQMGTPVIATNYSTNTEFTDRQSCCLVDYQLIEIKEKVGHYEKGSMWAEADSKQAAKYMKKLYSDRIYYENIVNNALLLSKKKIGNQELCLNLRQRIEEIYEQS